MDEPTVTWNPRRKHWIDRGAAPPPAVPTHRGEPASPTHRGEPAPATSTDSTSEAVQAVPVVIPNYPSFSPAAIADLLKVYRSTVQYWMANGKLDSFTDNIGERYVLRGELIRFVGEYLGKTTKK